MKDKPHARVVVRHHPDGSAELLVVDARTGRKSETGYRVGKDLIPAEVARWREQYEKAGNRVDVVEQSARGRP